MRTAPRLPQFHRSLPTKSLEQLPTITGTEKLWLQLDNGVTIGETAKLGRYDLIFMRHEGDALLYDGASHNREFVVKIASRKSNARVLEEGNNLLDLHAAVRLPRVPSIFSMLQLVSEHAAPRVVLLMFKYVGVPLHTLAQRIQFFDDYVALNIGIKVARVLHSLHRIGFRHKNIRPEHIIVDPTTLDVTLSGFDGLPSANQFSPARLPATQDFLPGDDYMGLYLSLLSVTGEADLLRSRSGTQVITFDMDLLERMSLKYNEKNWRSTLPRILYPLVMPSYESLLAESRVHRSGRIYRNPSHITDQMNRVRENARTHDTLSENDNVNKKARPQADTLRYGPPTESDLSESTWWSEFFDSDDSLANQNSNVDMDLRSGALPSGVKQVHLVDDSLLLEPPRDMDPHISFVKAINNWMD